MAIKKDELANPNSCINKAADDEPVFVLRARDSLAAQLVESWAHRAERHGCPKAKVDEAFRLAKAMEEWPNRKFPD